jgi:hypothetical protein
MVKQGSTIQTSHRVYKPSVMKVSKLEAGGFTGLKHATGHGDVIAFDVCNDLSSRMETLTKISPKSHAFENPDHFLIATVFSGNTNYTVYLWSTIEQGVYYPCEMPLVIDVKFRPVGAVKE